MVNSEILVCFEKFKNREVKAKEIFEIKEIEKTVAYNFVRQYHYLKDAKFFSKFAYGLFCCNELIGVAVYSNPQGIVALKGWFSLSNSEQLILELSRLCMLPQLNGTNATSYLLGNSIKMLKSHNIKAVITLADASRHIGSIYQVCNFKYYGLTDYKTDFFRYPDMAKNPRGKTSDVEGVWLPRSRKHRYAYILDNKLKCNYKEQPHPKEKGVIINKPCCDGKQYVYDNRFNQYYTCPYCTGKLEKFDENFRIYDNLVKSISSIDFNLEQYINENIQCKDKCRAVSFVYKLNKYDCTIEEKYDMFSKIILNKIENNT